MRIYIYIYIIHYIYIYIYIDEGLPRGRQGRVDEVDDGRLVVEVLLRGLARGIIIIRIIIRRRRRKRRRRNDNKYE